MQTFAMVVVFVLFGVLGVVVGHHIGLDAGQKLQSKKQYYLIHLALFVLLIFAYALLSTLSYVLIGLLLGLCAGVVAGLKRGYSGAVTFWSRHDDALLPQKKQRVSGPPQYEASSAPQQKTSSAPQQKVSVPSQHDNDEK